MKLTPCLLSAPSSSDDALLFSEMEILTSQQSAIAPPPSPVGQGEVASISQLLRASSASPESVLASSTAVAQQECQQMPTSVVQRGSSVALTASNGSSSALTAAAQQEKQRERTAFLERYNPQVCRLMALDADRCFRGNAPSLVRVKRDYGVQTAVTWMTIQLSETARLWGSSDKISGEMLEAVAESFVGEYSHLNLAEIGLYLSRLRAGVYGKVAYGKLTPDHMVSHVQTFLAQRSREIDVFRREQERIDRQRERKRWASRAVSHEEAKRRYAEALALCNNDPDRAIEYMKRVRR
ncbi:MAG: hypothetical protein HXK16_09725 [Alloprevotella sp.]|nr:hypothetical protein [Alloprevotella sp.]